MMISVLSFIKMLRPHQWVKNLFVFAPAFFAKQFFAPRTLLFASLGFIAFCCAASSVYILNDLVDRSADRAHPVKKNRPIASGSIAVPVAVATMLALTLISFAIAIGLPRLTGYCIVGYLALNIAYSFFLKRIAYVDAFAIASGFELRVLAGAAAESIKASTYLLVVTMVLALFLALGKRAHELSQGEPAYDRRAVLRHYSKRTLAILLYFAASSTIAVYLAYALDPETVSSFGTNLLPWTTVFVAIGVLRFVWLVNHGQSAESPTERMLSDWPFLTNIVLWTIAVLFLIYAK
ncbi:MAG: UbiA prenyltransferase family protein [Myxococcales bacterium]|nr:MAG: UbiA prenyltransferase family protein [Myxococcales bacterium]